MTLSYKGIKENGAAAENSIVVPQKVHAEPHLRTRTPGNWKQSLDQTFMCLYL